MPDYQTSADKVQKRLTWSALMRLVDYRVITLTSAETKKNVKFWSQLA